MKLLFDQNLSHRLIDLLGDLFPGSSHVRTMGLQRASDEEIWKMAKSNDYIIATKDSDFHERSLLSDNLPKVLWIRRGNCSTTEIADLLRQHYDEIMCFGEDKQLSVLVLT